MLKFKIADNNLFAMLKRNPFNSFWVGFRVLRGYFRRKVGFYTSLKLDRRVKCLNSKRGQLNFSQNTENKNYWKNQFSIQLDKEFKWSLERDRFLEINFYKIVKSNKLHASVDDKENYWSTFQLNWLFFKVRTGQAKVAEATAVIGSCCKFLAANKDSWIFRTFTLSEAVTNIVKIKFYFDDTLVLSKQVEDFLLYAVEFITENLEVYAVSNKTSLNHTNNHILANTRALFWATKVFKNDEIEETARHVYEKYCKQLFCSGDLDEGSTTYHLVATQCIFDISFFMEIKDLPRVDSLISKLKKNGFLTPDTFPVIGDISPDPSLACVITDALRVSKKIKDDLKNQDSAYSNISNRESITSEFEFFKKNNWSFVLHTRSPTKHIQHSHNDYGSPVLKYKNEVVICDLGRSSYGKTIGTKQLSLAKFHNVPQINNLEQNPRAMRDLYSLHHLSPRIKDIDWHKFQLSFLDKNIYEMICGKEFHLFPNAVYGGFWVRIFAVNRFDPDEFIIEDIVELDIPQSVTFRKFVPEKVTNHMLASFEFKFREDIISPFISKEQGSKFYGDSEDVNAYELSSQPSKNHNLTTCIRIKNEPPNIYR